MYTLLYQKGFFTASAEVSGGNLTVTLQGENLNYLAAFYAADGTILSVRQFFAGSFDIPYTSNMSEIKIFAWDSLVSLTPLTPHRTLKLI